MDAKKVFIGVGHGGKDIGALGNGMKESDVNLSIALETKRILKEYGLQVLLSREDNSDDPVEDEIAECRKFKPHIAIDIHANAGGGTGFEVFVQSKNAHSIRLAQSIEHEVYYIQKSRGIKTRLNSRGKDYYGFLRELQCPAVLLECAFLDSADHEKVDTEAERQLFAKAYAFGILRYFDIPYGNLHKVQVGAYRDLEKARKVQAELEALGYSTLIKTERG